MTGQTQNIDWSQGFALFTPLNQCSQVAVKTRLNRRYQVQSSRQSRPSATMSKRHIAIKLDFSMLLGRRCISFGTSRANNVTLPKGNGIGNVHFYVHLHPVTRILLLTVMAKSEVTVYDGTISEKSPISGATIAITKSTRLSFGTCGRFHFTIVPTLESIRNSDMDRMFNHWLKSIAEPTLQRIRPFVATTDAVKHPENRLTDNGVGCALR